MVSTYHIAVKFPADGREVTIRGIVGLSRVCYLRGIYGAQDKTLTPEDKAKAGFESGEPTEEVFMLGDERCFRVSSSLDQDYKKELTTLLYEHADVFSWTVAEMSGVSTDIACHRLNVSRTARPIKQKMRKIAGLLAQPIREEVLKL